MSTVSVMEVILLERIKKLGQMGDVIQVKPGYARNFLLPRGKALRATKQNKEDFNEKRAQLELTNLERKTEAQSIAERLQDRVFALVRQAGEAGTLYGSVTARDISERITEKGFTISKDQVLQTTAIKALGTYRIALRLHPEVEVPVTLVVCRNEEEVENKVAQD